MLDVSVQLIYVTQATTCDCWVPALAFVGTPVFSATEVRAS